MKRTAIEISREVLDAFPETAIGYTVVGNLRSVAHSELMTPMLKNLGCNSIDSSITVDNVVNLPAIARWRKVYEHCQVKPKTYKSSVESLVRRLIKDDYNPIIPLVDLYNFISAKYLLSAGGYNWRSLVGTVTLRFGQTEDYFIPLSGKSDIPVSEKHIVYADENDADNIVCWMWNHKDSRRTMLTDDTDFGLFLFDSLAIEEHKVLNQALDEFNALAGKMGGEIKMSGVIDRKNPLIVL